QWALLLGRLSERAGLETTARLSRALPLLILVAEVCSWYAVVTTNFAGHVLEESNWAFSGALLAWSAAMLWRRHTGKVRNFLAFSVGSALAYVVFMATVDVPMYLARWRADEQSGRSYLTLRRGLHDIATRWIVTRRWQDWRAEIPWMTLYFSVTVWI